MPPAAVWLVYASACGAAQSWMNSPFTFFRAEIGTLGFRYRVEPIRSGTKP